MAVLTRAPFVQRTARMEKSMGDRDFEHVVAASSRWMQAWMDQDRENAGRLFSPAIRANRFYRADKAF